MEDKTISEEFIKIFDQLKIYFNLRVEYLKLNVAEYLIRFFSSLVLWIVLFWILFFVVVFGSFAFAYWFGELTGKWALGFLMVAGIYVLIAILIYAFRRAFIVRPFTRLILSQMELDENNDTENEKE